MLRWPFCFSRTEIGHGHGHGHVEKTVGEKRGMAALCIGLGRASPWSWSRRSVLRWPFCFSRTEIGHGHGHGHVEKTVGEKRGMAALCIGLGRASPWSWSRRSVRRSLLSPVRVPVPVPVPGVAQRGWSSTCTDSRCFSRTEIGHGHGHGHGHVEKTVGEKRGMAALCIGLGRASPWSWSRRSVRRSLLSPVRVPVPVPVPGVAQRGWSSTCTDSRWFSRTELGAIALGHGHGHGHVYGEQALHRGRL